MKRTIITAALLLSGIYTFGQDVNKLIDQGDVTHIINTLAADDMQGRGTFTPGIEKAARFIESEYKNIGLEPMAGNKDYRQNFKMIHCAPVSTHININGNAIPDDHMFVMAGSSIKWANSADVQVVKITADQSFGKEFFKYKTSGKKTVILVDPHFESFFSQLRDAYGKGTTTFTEPNPDLQLVFVLGSFDEVKSYEANAEVKTELLPLFNIAGVLKGKSKPDEYVIFSAHYDHLGIIKPMEGDSIANGADDDASGTTAVISLAKYYKKLNSNARSIIFVAFTAEELGLLGSEYFSKQIDAQKVTAMFNIEMIGRQAKFGANSAFITGFERSDLGPILQKNLQGTAFKFYPDPYTQMNLFYQSDNASLAAVGVPAHTISTDQIDADKYYHTVKDEVSTLDIANITATIKAIALSSKSIVNGTDTPTRLKPVTHN